MIKVIFLDIDGVLTTASWKAFQEFNPVCVNLLKSVLKDSDFQLVISSTWRYDGLEEDSPLARELIQHDLKKYLHEDWGTKNLPGIRGTEIKEWVDRHEQNDEVEYIIVDDDQDMLEEQFSHFVATDSYDGLLFNHFIKLRGLAKLNGLVVTMP